MKRLLFLAVVTAIPVEYARADGVINIRVSYKVVLNPADGTRPPLFNDATLDASIAAANTLLDSFGRGYRFVRVDPITNVGGQGGFNRPNPSHYYGIDLTAQTGERGNMENDALANPALYAWNFGAINIYINDGNTGGICAFPSDELIAFGDSSTGNAGLHLHEIGHYFDLCHTQGCSCGCCGGGSGTCNTVPGSDGISDTLPDLACWDRDGIAQWNFGTTYNNLSPAQQNAVDDVFLNVMSYHASGSCGQGATRSRLTEKQLDRWADVVSYTRTSVRDGITVFVDDNAAFSQNGTSQFPFDTVAEGLGLGNSGTDIVLIRHGTYLENLTISAPVTLRAPRGATARIGN